MAVSSVSNVNCTYPAQQDSAVTTKCAVKPSFQGTTEESDKPEKSQKKATNTWLIGGIIAAAGAAALLIFKKDVFKSDTLIQKLVKNIEQQDTFSKSDFVEFGKENLEKIENFQNSFIMKLSKKFKTEHNLEGTKNLLLLGHYEKDSDIPILTKIIDCKKIGDSLKEILEKTNLAIFKEHGQKVI